VSSRFIEEDHCFDFNDDWRFVVAWDKHPVYRDGVRKVKEGKGVDFIGIHREKTLVFIEVKDFRPHRASGGWDRKDPPWVEFQKKVVSSVAALVGAHRTGAYEADCAPLSSALINRNKLKLVFWLDEPEHSNILGPARDMRRRVGAGVRTQQVKRYVNWLDVRASSASLVTDYASLLPGLQVTSLPHNMEARAALVVTELTKRNLPVDKADEKTITTERRPEKINDWLERVPFVTSAKDLLRGRS
jgi:hypothetical protein